MKKIKELAELFLQEVVLEYFKIVREYFQSATEHFYIVLIRFQRDTIANFSA